MLNYDPQTFREGELAYDFLQNSPVIVTDTTTPEVGGLDADTYDAVMEADGNTLLRAIGQLDDDTATVEVAFPGLKSAASKGYTYPTTRLLVPDLTGVVDMTAGQYGRVSMLSDVLAEARRNGEFDETVAMCRRAGVEPEVLEYAQAASDPGVGVTGP